MRQVDITRMITRIAVVLILALSSGTQTLAAGPRGARRQEGPIRCCVSARHDVTESPL